MNVKRVASGLPAVKPVVGRLVMVALIAASGFACASARGAKLPDVLHGNVGYFASAGVPAEIVGEVSSAIINAYSPAQVEASLIAVTAPTFRVDVDFSHVLKETRSDLSLRYQDSEGVTHTKTFAPLPKAKVMRLPDEWDMRERLDPYLDVLADHPAHVGTLFIADEPYLNGISRTEMERAAQILRAALDHRGLTHVRIGIIFASGLFDARFAQMLDRRAGDYALAIDQYHASGQAPRAWVETIQQARLTTYDQAGNIYTGGGVPDGFDVVAFNFYVSTLLLDRVHEHSLAWLATHTDEAACTPFLSMTMTQLRDRLSFFNDSITLPERPREDRVLLDAVYQCRVGALTSMLERATADRDVAVMLIGESSNNGLLTFTSEGRPKPQQKAAAVESRVLDEVRRAMDFYTRQRFAAGLVFFTYQDDHDPSIQLAVGGASSMPSVVSAIRHYARTGSRATDSH